MTTKKVFWRLLSIAVIAVLSVSLSACGGDNDDNDNDYESLRSAVFKEFANTSWKLMGRVHNGVSESGKTGSIVTFSTNSYEDDWIKKCMYVDGVLSGWWYVHNESKDNVTPTLYVRFEGDSADYLNDMFGFPVLGTSATYLTEHTSSKLTIEYVHEDDDNHYIKWYYVVASAPSD